jgi:hypothetical protein
MTDTLTRSNPTPSRAPRRLVRTLALAAAGALALGVTACSGDDEDPFAKVDTSRPKTTLSSGNAIASDAPTAVPTSGAKVEGAVLAQRMSAAATAKKSVAFDVLATGAEAISGTGAAKGTGSSSELKIDAKIGGRDLGIVKTGPTVYFKTPSPIGGKTWLKISQNPQDPLSRIYSQAFLGLDNLADVPRVASFVKGMGAFTEAAKEPVDGVQTTKYVAQPPPPTALRMLSGPYQGLNVQALKGAKTTVALWVDAEGLLRRSTVVLTVRNVPPAQTLVSYKNWGQPVTVQAPPPAEVLTGPTPAP